MPADYFHPKHGYHSITPHLSNFFSKAKSNLRLKTVNPSITYPAHTSMITGKNPSEHGIYNNTYFQAEPGKLLSWMWYAKEIKTKTLYDYFRKNKKKTASVYWPVTVGAKIDYNIPQIWISGNETDHPLLDLLSGGFYQWIAKKTGIFLDEKSSDSERVATAIAVWKLKKPDLLLLYTMDLDTVQHKYGPHSEEARQTLTQIDMLFGKFLEETGAMNPSSHTAIAVVSDHGFHTANSICKPNVLLKEAGLYEEKLGGYFYQSLGGIAILLKNKNYQGNLEEKKAWIQDKSMECGIKSYFSGPELEKARKELRTDIYGLMVSEGNVVFRNGTDSTLFEKTNAPIYTHGFLSEQADMLTVAGFYPPVPGALEDVKDIFYLSCKWMKMRCK